MYKIDLITKIEKDISKILKKTISIDDLYEIISKTYKINISDLKTTEYTLFYSIIKKLEQKEIIKKYGKDSNGRRVNPLNLKYRLINNVEKDLILSSEAKQLLYSLNKNIDTSYYFKNIDELEKDKNKLIILSDFLDSINENTHYISVNERSYELFGYEKALKGAKESVGSKKESNILQRTKLDIDKLNCFETYTPLQCYILPNFYKKESRSILIVENLDTYWSFHRALNDTTLGDDLDMLVYGGGNKVAGNFQFHRHYSISENDNILYFGDIDPAGLVIYKNIQRFNKNLNIKLAKDLYKLALEIGINKGVQNIKNRNQTFLEESLIEEILSQLDIESAKKFKDIIYNDKYIPQEVLNYRILVEKYKKEKRV